MWGGAVDSPAWRLGQVGMEWAADPRQSANAPRVVAIYLGLLAAGVLLDVIWGWRALRKPVDGRTGYGLRSAPWGLREVLRLALILAVSSVLGGAALHGLAGPAGRAQAAYQAIGVVVQSVLFHWLALFLAVWILWRRRTSWRAAFGLHWGAAGRGLLSGVGWYLGALPVIWGYSLVWHLVLRNYGVAPAVQDVLWIVSGESPPALRLYLLALAVLLAPLVEEIVFRGLALPALARRVGTPGAVILLSLVFAAVHGHIQSFAALFVVGIALALAYLRTGSLWTPIVMHGLFNGINLGLMIWLRSG